MKNPLAYIFALLVLLLAMVATGQQVTVIQTNVPQVSIVSQPVLVTNYTRVLQTNSRPVVLIPALTWTGAQAGVLADQLLSITNADGSLVVPAGIFNGSQSASINITIQPPSATNTLTVTARLALH